MKSKVCCIVKRKNFGVRYIWAQTSVLLPGNLWIITFSVCIFSFMKLVLLVKEILVLYAEKQFKSWLKFLKGIPKEKYFHNIQKKVLISIFSILQYFRRWRWYLRWWLGSFQGLSFLAYLPCFCIQEVYILLNFYIFFLNNLSFIASGLIQEPRRLEGKLFSFPIISTHFPDADWDVKRLGKLP